MNTVLHRQPRVIIIFWDIQKRSFSVRSCPAPWEVGNIGTSADRLWARGRGSGAVDICIIFFLLCLCLSDRPFLFLWLLDVLLLLFHDLMLG